jgi:hypothetical protein
VRTLKKIVQGSHYLWTLNPGQYYFPQSSLAIKYYIAEILNNSRLIKLV